MCKHTLLEISEEIYQHFAVLFSHQHGERKQCLCKRTLLEISEEIYQHFAVLFSHQHGERKQFLCKHTLLEISEEIYQHFAVLFSHQHGERKQFLCKCSFLEIYQEQVYDLLDPAAANLQLRENMKKGVFVDGLVEQVVATPTEAYQVLCMHAHGIMHYIYVFWVLFLCFVIVLIGMGFVLFYRISITSLCSEICNHYKIISFQILNYWFAQD